MTSEEMRLDYLLRMYEYYTNHTNTIFNFYLVLSGLLATAYVGSISEDASILPGAGVAIGVLGALLSVFFSKIDARSRDLMSRIQRRLQRDEETIHTDFLINKERKETDDSYAERFLTKPPGPPSSAQVPGGHGQTFRWVFRLVTLAFIAAAIFAPYANEAPQS